jgi:hypothetical protein
MTSVHRSSSAAGSPITGCPKPELAGERFGSVASGDRFDACAWKRPLFKPVLTVVLTAVLRNAPGTNPAGIG